MKRTAGFFVTLTAALLLAASLVLPVIAQNFSSLAVLDGDATSPSITFFSDTDTGFYRAGANSIGISTGGTSRGTITSGGLNLPLVRTALVSASAGPTTLTAADCGKTIISTRTSTTAEFVMPKVTTAGAGCFFQFSASTSAASEILLTPDAADNYSIKATEDAGASVVTAAGTGVKNTAATNVIGDHLALVSDGVLTWVLVGQSGIWASR